MKIDRKLWTYGSELELGDLDQLKGLPSKQFGWDKRDVTMVNSNGIAVDPKGISWTKGGEINLPPTGTIRLQVEAFQEVLDFHPDSTINYRSNLHLHIRVPGLKDNLELCKKVQRYVYANRDFLQQLEPIPKPLVSSYPDAVEFAGALRRYNRRRTSHHTVLTDKRYVLQQAATNMKEFYAAEAPAKKDGTPLFHLAPRCAVNMRQFQETDTIEFRHFPGTLDSDKFQSSLLWCRDFLWAALTDGPTPQELLAAKDYDIPKFKKYIHWMEMLYRNTVHDGSIPRAQIEENIKKIVSGKWSKENLPIDPSVKPRKGVTLRQSAVDRGTPIVGELELSKVEYPEGTSTVNLIRGTSGSGKTTLMYNLILNKSYGFTPVFRKPKEGEAPKAGSRAAPPIGYRSKKLNAFIVGNYSTACGGCDGVTTVDEVVHRAKSALSRGYHVLMEGLLISGLHSKLTPMAKNNPMHIYLLSTTVQDCLDRVVVRRAQRGEKRELDPKNTIDKFMATMSSTKSMSTFAKRVKVVTNEVAYVKILRTLGIKDPIDFDPNIYASTLPEKEVPAKKKTLM